MVATETCAGPMCCSLAGARAGEPLGSGARRRRELRAVPCSRARAARCSPRRARLVARLLTARSTRDLVQAPVNDLWTSARRLDCSLDTDWHRLIRSLMARLRWRGTGFVRLSKGRFPALQDVSHGRTGRPGTRCGLDEALETAESHTQRSGQHDARRAQGRGLTIDNTSTP